MSTPSATLSALSDQSDRIDDADLPCLRHTIEHCAHYLPSQGPITVFVHHNTLHAFEDLDFDQGVQAGGRLFGCHAYLPEERYRQKLQAGRIRAADLDAVLIEDLGDEADRLVANFGTRYALRLAMLQYPFRTGSTAELQWLVAETDALRRFRVEVDQSVRDQMIAQTREWVLRRLDAAGSRFQPGSDEVLADVLQQFDRDSIKQWHDETWEALVLNYLWRVCCNGLRQIPDKPQTKTTPFGLRHRDSLLAATGEDADLLVHEVLIKFCSAFLDQGFADWELPERHSGFFAAFLKLYGQSFAAPTPWFADLRNESRRIVEAQLTPIASVAESLTILGVDDSERESFITQSLLALRGWAGMVWQMETNAEWAPHPAPAGSLVEFLAVRLILDRIAMRHVARETLGFNGPLNEFREKFSRRDKDTGVDTLDQRAFTVFQLAQVRGWKPGDLELLSQAQWQTLVTEIESFPSLERRRIYHRAFERKYRNETLDAVIAHTERMRRNDADSTNQQSRPDFQIVCCIDEREESFRRHLEEIQPACETLGVAGFFGVAMYYRGAEDAHFTPLCPVNVKPQHYVVEQPLYSAAQVERRRAETRRRLGHATHQAHRGTRTFLGGVLAGLFGSFAAFPLVARILFPRTTSQIQRLFRSIVHTPNTELRLERTDTAPGSANGQIGYSVDEMAGIVEGGLKAIGLRSTSPPLGQGNDNPQGDSATEPDIRRTAHDASPPRGAATDSVRRFSRLVVICGHGSASLNNPHEAAHDCGACGGGRGGPNARAFAQMANDARVRRILQDRGLLIPEDTYFVGGYHNTCDDSMTWYDLDRVPVPHRERFESAKLDIDEARKRSSHERCRRFESAHPALGFDDALRHVEGRSEDLSQTRPEYGHATNALCFVGRRDWSRGLFLDRRAFLTSYDTAQDDAQSSTLERLLQAVIPVCAGINLEYYFSYVDPTGYGCGTKLPHNITSLLGVMDGAASDLRPGLPWQMVEIHEPVRLLFAIESTAQALLRIINENEAIAGLVRGGWVQLAVFDPATSLMHRYVRGEFVLYSPEVRDIPVVESSTDWYRGQRTHLGFASIVPRPSEFNSNEGTEAS